MKRSALPLVRGVYGLGRQCSRSRRPGLEARACALRRVGGVGEGSRGGSLGCLQQ